LFKIEILRYYGLGIGISKIWSHRLTLNSYLTNTMWRYPINFLSNTNNSQLFELETKWNNILLKHLHICIFKSWKIDVYVWHLHCMHCPKVEQRWKRKKLWFIKWANTSNSLHDQFITKRCILKFHVIWFHPILKYAKQQSNIFIQYLA